ncbi:PLP-dependent aminotransferase family protein [Halomonas pacifica]|uniref:MocR-like pyridoxine biosynthesis transcription factor PdxR n=1 Tax=Bisbaumannia pacifica TaxID=77098 RepID=UPI00235A46F5|nr:PLP-dependent aminotransferase family protein [Halomonas pacifica]MDC8803164.1 PLP-dependent aminotransferase family protein [Halomonas pacifica]
MEPVIAAHADWVGEALGIELMTPSSQSLARRLYRALRGWIQSGRLASGSRLPSSRRLARDLGVGRNTLLEAIEQLVAEGFLETRPGAGTFVADLPFGRGEAVSEALAEKPPSEAPEAALSARGERLLRFCASPGDHHAAFAPGVPALDRFPRELWQRLLKRHQRDAPEAWLDYRTQGGVTALREALCDYLRLSRSVRCRPEQVLVVQGAQQGFELIARMLSDPGDVAWLEEPGYGGAQACFDAAGLEMVAVPVDGEGLDLKRVPPGQAAPRLIYVTPSHQYPSGVTMSLPRRLALLEAAETHGAWIVEDDYDSEFRYGQRPIAALQGLSEAARVIYVGTLSKVLYPGLRLGYLVLPEALVAPFRRANARLHREGQYAVQAALAEFIAAGHFSRHVRRMRDCYRQRQALLRRALAPAVARGLALSEGQAGMHLVAWLDDRDIEQALVRRAAEQGIGLSPLSGYYLTPPGRPGLVLGYAGARDEEILRAGEWLARAWLALAESRDRAGAAETPRDKHA